LRNPNNENDTIEYCDLCCLQPNGNLKWSEFADKAIVDGPTKYGPSAYMCERHLELAGYKNSKLNYKLKQ
jgi:hypothetical protein